MQPVITAFHFDDAVAAGGGPSKAHGMHGAFRSAVAEADHLHWETLTDFFREFPFEIMRHAEHRAGSEFALDGLDHRGMAVPGH